jgi:hypothetical protein
MYAITTPLILVGALGHVGTSAPILRTFPKVSKVRDLCAQACMLHAACMQLNSFCATMMKLIVFITACSLKHRFCEAYNVSPARKQLTRRDFGLTTAAAALSLSAPNQAIAFDGSGSSAYTGKTPTSKAELQRSYRARIAADVGDFNDLGAAIRNGEISGDTWVKFFIPYARREPDSVGRAYAALADLVGAPDRSGCGYLYAASFVKPGKPPETSPGVKKYNSLAKSLAPIEVDGKKGDAAKAQKDWEKASVAFSEFLEAVDMPSNLDDNLYK